MASKEKTARLEQKVYWEDKLNQRLTLLTDRGAESGKISRDTTVRGLRANIRETDKRLKAIEGKEKKLEELAKIKAEKLAAPKEKEKKGKTSEEKPGDSKRQQKKKKKKEKKEAKNKD